MHDEDVGEPRILAVAKNERLEHIAGRDRLHLHQDFAEGLLSGGAVRQRAAMRKFCCERPREGAGRRDQAQMRSGVLHFKSGRNLRPDLMNLG